MITQYINEGKIVPVEVTVSLIRKAMAASGASKFLVDGFPRNFNNLEGWNKVMGDSASVEGVLFYECPEEVMESRLLHRGKSSGRSDDKADVIKKRFNTYVQETMPVIDYFRQRNKVRIARLYCRLSYASLSSFSTYFSECVFVFRIYPCDPVCVFASCLYQLNPPCNIANEAHRCICMHQLNQ